MTKPRKPKLTAEQLYAEMMQLGEYPRESFLAQILWVQKNYKPKPEYKTLTKQIGTLWGRKAKLLYVIGTTFKSELKRNPDYWELMSMYELARLNKFERAKQAKAWRDKTLSYTDIQKKVAELLTPKPRAKHPDVKRIGDDLAAAVRSNHLQGQKDYDIGCHVCACLKAWEDLK